MAIHDETRGAAAKRRVAVRVRQAKRKPLPMPDMQAALEVPHVVPKPAPRALRSVVYKRPPARPQTQGIGHGGHVPIVIQKESPLDVHFQPREGSLRAKQIAAYNQTLEKQRRAEIHHEQVMRDARKAEVANLPKPARDAAGRDALHDYIIHGPSPHGGGLLAALGAVGGAVGAGAKSLAADKIAALLGAAQAPGRPNAPIPALETPAARAVGAAGQTLQTGAQGVGDVVIGPDLIKAATGKPYDKTWAIGELALLPLPLRGLPTPITSLLRATVGAERLARGVRDGETVAEILSKPIGEVKAARRASLIEKAATAAPGSGPIASSRIAGKIADILPEGRVARFVRNDVRSPRVFTVGNEKVATAADLSRTGKLARKALDSIRDSRLVPLRSNETLGLRALARQTVAHADRAAGLEHTLNGLVGGKLRGMSYPEQYAVRAVAKGHTPDEAIARATEAMARLQEEGDRVGVEAQRVHIAMFEKAKDYVTTNADGAPVFRPDAPPRLEELRRALERVSGTREDIYRRLDKLSDETMRTRILNEQLYYAKSEYTDPGADVRAALEANPIRQKIAQLFQRHRPEAADRGLAILDANARRVHEAATADLQQKIAETKAAIARNPDAPHLPRLQRDLADYQQQLATLDPAHWYSTISDVADVLPQDIVDKISEKRGQFGTEWRFSLHGGDDEVRAASKRIGDEVIASGLPLPPEWSTPEKIHDGIHEVFRLAREGEYGKDWYQTAADGVQRVSEVTGVDPRTVAQLFAIYSQAADTIANSTFVFKAIKEFQKYGDLFVGRFPTRQSEEALSVLKGGAWEGRKRSSFYANILRHLPGQEDEYARVIAEMAADRGAPVQHPVTVDRWVVRMFNALGKTKDGKDKDVPGKFYDTFETIMQKMADHVGWEPEQLQAAAWVTKKAEGIEAEVAKAGGKVTGPLKARFDAGAGDAFEAGIARGIEKFAEEPTVHPQLKRLANQANRKWGGFTVTRDLKPVPEEGYSVSYSLTERSFKLHGLTGEDIAKFRDDYAGMLKDPRNRIGGFSDDANDVGDANLDTRLSITRHFKRKADAMKFAREQGQETVYEYKTGDGIRTGLTRDEQIATIDALDRTHLKGGPESKIRPLTAEQRDYEDFLDRAAHEFGYAKEGKPSNPSQRARAEEWLSQKGHQFEDEPIVQEYYDRVSQTQSDLPDWALPTPVSPEAEQFQFSVADGQLGDVLFSADGAATPGAEVIAEKKGAELARTIPGHDEAVAALARQEIPHDFIQAVANSPLHIYDRLSVGRYLDQLSGGVLKGRDWSDPAVKRMFPEVLTLAGLWEAETRRLYWSAEAHPIDWIHEVTHALETADAFPPRAKESIWRHVGAEPGDKLTHDQSEDVADILTSTVLGFDPARSTLPDEVKAALVGIRDAVRKSQAAGERAFTREEEMLKSFPEEERQFIEDIFRFQPDEAPHYTNGFKPRPGQYLPERPGLPYGGLNPLAPRRSATLWSRMLGGKKVKAVTQTDQHLTHAWRAGLAENGRWEKGVVNGPIEGLLKAQQVEKMHVLHQEMLKIGFDQPTTEHALRDWIMVPVDPKQWTAKTRAKVRDAVDLLKAFDTGDKVTEAQLSKVDAQAIEDLKDFMFPGLTDSSVRHVEQFVQRALQQPIDGVVWVPRSYLERTGMFDAPIISGLGEGAVSKVVYTADTMNNIMKMMTLSLNPAYYPMNIAGQNIMLMSQLGFTAPFSLARTLRQMRNMSEEDLALIDRFSGIGFAGSMTLTEGGALKQATNAVGHVSTILVDKYPRRASFFHEARRLGYKTEEQISSLVNDVDKFDDLMRVHERVQRAMVDYGGLNRYERGIATHLIFVYPWLRGAGRYTMQFPFDHPFQAAAFAGLVYWQQNRLHQALPEGHPGYMKWFMPINAPKDGTNPYGFRMDQLATPLQTMDIASQMVYWGTGGKFNLPWGSNEEAPASMLGPLAEAIEQTVSGWDSFRRQQVTSGIPGLFASILSPSERYASWQKMSKILNHQTHKGIYDTNQTQNWLRLFLGSLAPINIDAGKAGDMSAPSGTISPSQSRDKYVAKIEEVNGAPLSDAQRATITQWKANDQTYQRVSRKYRDEHEIEGDSTIQERAAMLLLTYGEVVPEAKDVVQQRAEAVLHVDDASAQEAYDQLRKALGLSQLGTLDGRIRKAQREARTNG